jgi:hypothetical protein
MDSLRPYSESKDILNFFHNNINFNTNDDNIQNSYIKEIMEHISGDQALLSKEFDFKGELKRVNIKRAGNETHYGGKVSLFLTLETDQEVVKIVYKPRSVVPEKCLEEVLATINEEPSRKIVDCGNYGYDTFMEGFPLKKLNSDGPLSGYALTSKLVELANKNPKNRNLILVLKYMGFEDTHGGNFLLDRNGHLYFIDAEVYQTKVSVNVDDVYNQKENQFEKGFPKDTALEERIQKEVAPFIIRLRQEVPTRLVVCSTQIYAFPVPFFMPSTVTIGPCQLEAMSTGKDKPKI